MEHTIPQWLQKELDQFGLFDDSKPVAKIKRGYPEPTGWMPSYANEEPPF